MIERRNPLAAYGISLAVVGMTVIIRLLLDPVLSDRLPFHILFVGVVFAAWFGGRGPGLFALAASSLAAVFFILEPRFEFSIRMQEYRVGLLMYVVVGLATIAMIASLRHAWRQASEKSKLLATILSRMGDGVIVVDQDRTLLSINPVAEVLTGWSLTEAKGQPLSRVFHVVDEQSGEPIPSPVEFAMGLSDTAALPSDSILISRDGLKHDIEASVTPLSSNGGIALVFRDTTEQRRLFGRSAKLSAKRA